MASPESEQGAVMFLEIKGVLNQAEVARLTEIARSLKFIEGRATNPANETKQNLQADWQDPLHAETSNIALQGLMRSREFRDFAFPERLAPPMLAKYEPGMKYGPHPDNAFLPLPGQLLRSDVSVTIFLSPPDAYEGGELAVHVGSRAVPFKLQPGSAIVYPSTTLHEVVPVRSGERLVAITFVQSQIADELRRNLLYELNEVAALEGLNMKWENRIRFEAVRNNLWRLWSAGH